MHIKSYTDSLIFLCKTAILDELRHLLFVLDITGAALQCPAKRDVISVCVCVCPPSFPETNPPNVKADVG